MDLCQKTVKCYDNAIRLCVRPAGHLNGCNPFSDTDPATYSETPTRKAMRQTPDGPPGEDHRQVFRKMDQECHAKALARGETTFTLVEHDVTSPRTILFWISENFDGKTPASKLRDAFEDALSMLFSPVEKRRPD